MSPIKLFLTLCILMPVVNAATVAERSLKICVANNAAPEITAAAKIADAARIQRSGPFWKGPQPAYGWGTEASPRPLSLRQHGEWVLLSTLPEANSDVQDQK